MKRNPSSKTRKVLGMQKRRWVRTEGLKGSWGLISDLLTYLFTLSHVSRQPDKQRENTIKVTDHLCDS